MNARIKKEGPAPRQVMPRYRQPVAFFETASATPFKIKSCVYGTLPANRLYL